VITIELRGLELHGRHGAEPEEQERGQRFLFDIALDVSDVPAADRIEDTIDYREVAAAVREVSDGRRFTLLESLAAAVADALVARFDPERVRVRVRKPDVVLDPPVEWSAATVERSRD
jgi:7,8-dihydroneopterin aldolase/epimerase/oxygenase